MSERSAYQNFKKNVERVGDRIDRIENCLVLGMPDINCCFDGTEVWIELKSPIEPKKGRTPLFGSNHKVSQDQANWMLRQKIAGGRAYFLISTDKRLALLASHFSMSINDMTIDEIIDNASWSAMKPLRDKELWEALREVLVR